MLIKQISAFVENKKGRLTDITKALAEQSINIRALSIADTTDFGILRMIVDRPDQAVESLKAQGMTVSLTNVLAIAIPDIPGGFYTAIKVLSDADISVEYAYAFITPKAGSAYVIIRVEDNEKAIQIFEANNIKLLSQDDIF